MRLHGKASAGLAGADFKEKQKMKKYFICMIGLLSIFIMNVAFAASITWDQNTEPDIAGYNIFDNEANIATVLHPNTVWEIPEGTVGTHVYRLTAFDWAGNESEKSEPVIYVNYPGSEDTEGPGVPSITIIVE